MANCVEFPVGVHVASGSKVEAYFALKDIAARASEVSESCEKDRWGCLPRVEGYAGFGGYLCVIVARSAEEASRCEADMRDFIAKYSAEHPDMVFTFGTEGL